MTTGIELRGFEALQKKLTDLPRKDARKIARVSIRNGAKVFQRALKADAPRGTGRLRQHIKVRAVKRSRKHFGAMVRTGTRKELKLSQGGGYYPLALEYGTEKMDDDKAFWQRNFDQNVLLVASGIVSDLSKRIRIWWEV